MPWSAVAGAAASAVIGSALSSGGSSGGSTSQAAGMADPFAGQRGQYQGMLQNLMTNPNYLSTTPGYQWQFNQGLEAVNRTEAAKGMLGSGNRLQELMQYGQGMAQQDYNNQFVRLAQLAGANVGSPGTAGSLQQGYNNMMAQGAGQIAGSLGNAIGSMFTTNTQSSSPSYDYFAPSNYSAPAITSYDTSGSASYLPSGWGGALY